MFVSPVNLATRKTNIVYKGGLSDSQIHTAWEVVFKTPWINIRACV